MKHRFTAWLCLFGMAACASATAQDYPAPIEALADQGIVITNTMSAPEGFKGYVGQLQGRRMPIYLLPDGKHTMIGSLFDAKGNELTAAAFSDAAMPTLADSDWKALGQSAWVAEGADDAARIVYVFTDTECPFCHQLWQATQPYLSGGKIQVRHIIVAVIAPASVGRGAAILGADDPAAALRKHEQGFGTDALAPAKVVAPALQKKMDANRELMQGMGIFGTPAVIWRDAKGEVRMVQGMPEPARIESVFGG